MEMEKVMRGLECCCAHIVGMSCENCPYEIEREDEGISDCTSVLAYDALVLLKEPESVKRTYRTGINGFSIIWTCGACGSDLYPNNAKAKYCSNCGQAVKWE